MANGNQLPSGFELDQPATSNTGGLPPGFQLDASKQPPKTTKRGGIFTSVRADKDYNLGERQSSSPQEALDRIQAGDFSMLPTEVVADIEKRFPVPDMSPQEAAETAGYTGFNPIKRQETLRNTELYKQALRQERPELSKIIEEMGPGEVALIASGKKVEDVLQGLGRTIGVTTQEEAADTPEYQALTKVRPGPTAVGELGTEAAMFAFPASQTARIASVPGRIAATAAAEGTASGLITAGEGGTPGDIATSTAIGAGFGGAFSGPFRRKPGRTQAAEEQTGPYRSPDTGLAVEPPESIRRANLPDIEAPPSLQPRAQTENLPVESIDVGDAPLPRRQQLRQAIERGDREAVGYKIENNRVVKDKPQLKALDEGFDPGTVMMAKKMNPSEKMVARDMLARAERYLASPEEGVRRPVAEPIGDAVMKRLNKIEVENKKASLDQKKAISDLRGQKIDDKEIVDNFEDALNDYGYERVVTKDGVKLKANDPTLRSNPGNKHLQVINDMLQKRPTGGNLQRLKDYLDAKINWDSDFRNTTKMDANVLNMMKNVRKGVNEKLRQASPDYAAANDRLSETIRGLQEFGDTMGSKFDPNNPDPKLIGKQTRKMLSNYGVGDPMLQAIEKLDSLSSKYGATFNDDPVRLAQYYSDLEKRFGSFRPNSFQGNIEKGTNAANTAIDAATGNYRTATVDALKGGADMLRPGTPARRASLEKLKADRKAIRAMRELLRGN